MSGRSAIFLHSRTLSNRIMSSANVKIVLKLIVVVGVLRGGGGERRVWRC
jgi:hypothetical protein